MDDKAGFTAKMRSEAAKLKTMSFKEKREYIWEYYKISIIATTVVLLILGSLINSWFINPPKKDFLFIAWMGGYVTDTQTAELSKTLVDALVADPERETVTISTFFTSDDGNYNMAMYNRLIAMISAGELDIFIMDRMALEDMAFAGYLAPLDELITMLPAHFSALITPAQYRPDIDADPVTGDYGINLTDCPMLTSLGIYTDDMYLGVVVNSKKVPDIARALSAMYE